MYSPARMRLLAVVIGVAAALPVCAHAAKEHPDIVLAWDDSGDYGPATPGTKTAGWQEAIDACVAQGRDLYVKGGFGGRKPIYHVQDTIHLPPTQDFRIDGGLYVLNWTGPADDPAKDLMLIDSTMNGDYRFGIFVYGGAGAALHIRPEHPVPVDNVAVFTETSIVSQGGIADPKPFEAGERRAGTGLLFDATKASIVSSRFDFVGGILNFKTCIETRGPFVQNQFDCRHLHTNAHKSTLFRLGPDTSQSTFACVIGVDQGATEVRGFDVAGRNNVFRIQTRGGFPKGQDFVLAPDASGNRVELVHGRTGTFDLAEYLTDHATAADNVVTWTGGSLSVATVTPEKSPFVFTQRLYPATLFVDGGTVSRAQFVRGGDTLDLANGAHAGLPLSPGDQVHIEFTEPPTLRLVPQRH